MLSKWGIEKKKKKKKKLFISFTRSKWEMKNGSIKNLFSNFHS
jgi:hypothetical protein